MGSADSGWVRIVLLSYISFFILMSNIKGRYARIEIPLDKAETGKELHIVGDYLSIISITGEGSCEIKLDHRHSQIIDFREISGITGPFERLYFSTDGAGGVCSMFVGTGMAINISANKENVWSGWCTGAHITTVSNVVISLASEPLKLEDVTIQNSNPTYDALVGPYASNYATFRNYASLLYAKETLKFRKVDMYSLGCCASDNTNHVIIRILGRYE